ncbi:MAG: caspase family protein [Thermoguttaceae bacterium]
MKTDCFFIIFVLCICWISPTLQGQSLLSNVPVALGATSPPRRDAAISKPAPKQDIIPKAIEKTSDWRCLLFAVEQYDEKTQNLPPLRGCYNDMIAAKTDWLGRIGIGDDRIVFLNDRNTKVAPTRERFMAQLEKLCNSAAPSTNLVVAVSSHGIAKNGKSYVCPIDVVYRPDQEEWDNLISVSDILDRLKSSKAGRKLLIIDACRSVGKSTGNEDFMNEFAKLSKGILASSGQSTSGMAVITSCSLSQEAHEMQVNGEPRGVFMKYFIEGLAGPADYFGLIDGNITLSEAYSYAFSQTSKFVYLCRNKNQQTPELFRENDLTSFVLAPSEPSRKQPNESDMQFLLRQSMELATRGNLALATDVLTHIIGLEPNNQIAVASRAGMFLAAADYSRAMDDCTRLGRTLDLYLCFSDSDTKKFQAEINKLKTIQEQKNYTQKNRKISILNEPNVAANVGLKLEPGQKVSITRIEGSWFYVFRIDDNVAQNGVGWIHKDNLTWNAQTVEKYRPQTAIYTPDGGGSKIGGLNFRQQSGMAGGGSGRAVMQRTIGGGGI